MHDGIVPLGCLCSNMLQVTGVLGAIPLDVRALHAFPNNPSLALKIADRTFLLDSLVCSLGGLELDFLA